MTFHQSIASKGHDERTARSSPRSLLRERFAYTLRKLTRRILSLRRGFTLEVTPVPIPNTAVKLQRADDTSLHIGGKVGRRDVNIYSAPESFTRFGGVLVSRIVDQDAAVARATEESPDSEQRPVDRGSRLGSEPGNAWAG